MLASENRPIRAGDILILVRKRTPFAPAMISALKARGIKVAGADRLVLTEQIAVQDLMALGDFLTLPEDDLALASILKSPLFGLDDDDLLALAPKRRGFLWQELLARAGTEARFREAAETLKRWRARADLVPPFEFFCALLDADGMRARMLERLGAEAADAIDELLNLALAYDDGAAPSLQGFLSWLREGTRVVKRDMEQGLDEVRVMTVHGAKGLEAPIVFLPDTCSTRSARPPGGLLKLDDAQRPADAPAPFVWPVKGTGDLATLQLAKAAVARGEAEERNRLLYVALTRARDRLYVAGFEGANAPPADCWYNLIRQGLGDRLEGGREEDGRVMWRIASAQTAKHEPSTGRAPAPAGSVPLPAWAEAARAAGAADRDAARSIEARAARERCGWRARGAAYRPPCRAGDPAAFHARGGCALPARHPHDTRCSSTCRRCRASAGPPPRNPSSPTVPRRCRLPCARASLPRRWPCCAIRRLPRCSAPRPGRRWRSSPKSLNPSGTGPPLRLAGKIDRLVRDLDSILIVDYKTNRPPPKDVAQVAEAYLLQLAAYRLAVARIFSRQRVRAAILWTDGPRIMEIPQAMLDAAEQRLWQASPANLDA